jgi:hypothetical protein
VLETIYAPGAYYARCREFLRIYRQRTVSKIRGSGVKAFFKSLWRIGILNEEGFRGCYWKLVIRSIMTRPKTLGEVVRLMIVGIHFRKCLLKDRKVSRLSGLLDVLGEVPGKKKAA